MNEFTAESYMSGALDALRAGNDTDAAQHMMAALGLLGVVERVERAPLDGEDLRPDGLTENDRANFHTLHEAFANDDVAILHAREKATGHHRALLCVLSGIPDSDDTKIIPVAVFIDGDVTEQYDDPMEGEHVQPINYDAIADSGDVEAYARAWRTHPEERATLEDVFPDLHAQAFPTTED